MRGLLGLIGIGLIIWILVALAKEKRAHLAATKAAYERSLARLKEDPNNPELKQRTLTLGRTYSNLTRNKKGVAVYDEVALSNDINSACAAVSVPPSSTETSSPEDHLSQLSPDGGSVGLNPLESLVFSIEGGETSALQRESVPPVIETTPMIKEKPSTTETRLQELKSLFDKHLVTEEEYERKRAEILKEL
jgi:hypothetical protein